MTRPAMSGLPPEVAGRIHFWPESIAQRGVRAASTSASGTVANDVA